MPLLKSIIELLKVLEQEHSGRAFVDNLLYYLHEKGEVSDGNEFETLIATELPIESGAEKMTPAQIFR